MFIKETITRLRAAGTNGEIVLRADSGFYVHDVVTACRAAEVRFSIGVRMIGGLRGVIGRSSRTPWRRSTTSCPALVAEIS